MYPITFKIESRPVVVVELPGGIIMEVQHLLKGLNSTFTELGHTYFLTPVANALSDMGVCTIEECFRGVCKCTINDNTLQFRRYLLNKLEETEKKNTKHYPKVILEENN